MRLEYFQLIDRIVDIDVEGRKLSAEANVPTTSTIFEGHFPGHPLMPGVLLMETMAQASGWLIIAMTKFNRMPFLAAFRQAKLRSFVTPGMTLSVAAEITHEGSGYAFTKASIRAEGKLVCDADITFRVVEFPTPEFRSNMEKIAAMIAFPREVIAHG
jgi:3-hydroxyacyl-[acyl-carrier-protein] dehydratase